MAFLSSGSTLKASAMHCVATSIDSFSSVLRVPSVVELLRKSMTASASFFFDSVLYDNPTPLELGANGKLGRRGITIFATEFL